MPIASGSFRVVYHCYFQFFSTHSRSVRAKKKCIQIWLGFQLLHTNLIGIPVRGFEKLCTHASCGREPALPAFSTDAHPRKMFMGGTRPAIPCQHFRGVCYQKRVLFSLQVSYINACLWLCFFPYTCFLTLLMGYMRTLAERPCTSQQNMVPSRGRAPHRL